MARSKSKKVSFLSRLGSRLKDLIPLFVFFALVLNLLVVYRFESTRDPQVIYSVQKVPVTNFVERVIESVDSSGGSRSSPSNSVSSNSVSVSVYYDYFIALGSRVAKIWGRYYSEGSLTSYGRIIKIFPDRIFLENDIVFSNLKSYSPAPNYTPRNDRFSNFKSEVLDD